MAGSPNLLFAAIVVFVGRQVKPGAQTGENTAARYSLILAQIGFMIIRWAINDARTGRLRYDLQDVRLLEPTLCSQ